MFVLLLNYEDRSSSVIAVSETVSTLLDLAKLDGDVEDISIWIEQPKGPDKQYYQAKDCRSRNWFEIKKVKVV